MTDSRSSREIRGPFVVAALVLLTAVVGTLFIVLGPRATERHPGVLHVGVRYANEGTADLLRYNDGRPVTRFLLYTDSPGDPLLLQEGLGVGRNLVPIKQVASGDYVARVEADGFHPAEFAVRIEGRLVLPVAGADYPEDSVVDRNLIGVRLLPVDPDQR